MNNIIPKRSKNGIAYRYVEGRIMTLFGLSVGQCWCRECRQIKIQSEFYHKTLTDGSKKAFRVCIDCADKRRLRDAKIQRRRARGIFVDKNLQPINSLEKFLDD